MDTFENPDGRREGGRMEGRKEGGGEKRLERAALISPRMSRLDPASCCGREFMAITY